ncbi:hypothetical protein DVJ83_13755 (plasmid) [Deinococcus wulumuqiensis]|uniref:Uncharacterized protein n=1 Tax=Deinococcus wulumuqiensis TaxID=980427 RepID=A0A345IKN5_9DEIO|nr:hypothetical protein DVJ83_13755 [Deinococcus wulumuqiensis]
MRAARGRKQDALTDSAAPRPRLYGFRFIPAQSGLYSWEGAACASISQNPYFFLLASALLRSFASRIESETTRFNRNPYYSTRSAAKRRRGCSNSACAATI